ERALVGHKVEWKIIPPQTFISAAGAALTRQADGSLLAGGTLAERDTYSVSAASPLATITAVRLEVLADESLPHRGPGRQENGNFHLSEFQLFLFEPCHAAARRVAAESHRRLQPKRLDHRTRPLPK